MLEHVSIRWKKTGLLPHNPSKTFNNPTTKKNYYIDHKIRDLINTDLIDNLGIR